MHFQVIRVNRGKVFGLSPEIEKTDADSQACSVEDIPI